MSVVDYQSEYVDDVLSRLDEVVADLVGLCRGALPADVLNELLLRESRLVSQAQGVQALSMLHAMDSHMSVRFGSRLLTTHLVKHTGQSAQVVGSARALAEWLADFPVLLEAFVAGDVSQSHVRELKKIDNPRVHRLLVRDQRFFVDAAVEVVWTDWVKLVAYWLNAADPDGELSDPANPEYGMTVRTSANGDVHVTMVMDPVTGEAFLTMHDHELAKIERNEAEQRNIDPNFVNTSLRKKNLDALLRLMVRGWRRADGSYPDFLVNIVMSQPVAEDLLARTYGHVDPETGDSPLDVDPFEVPIDWTDIDGRCETIRGTPLHPKHALGALLAGQLRRSVLGAADAVINHGVGVRLFDKTQRNLLLVLQRGQCALGTQTPFRWLEADHVQPASKGGPTDIANGQMINGSENKAKRDTWPHETDGGE